MNRLKTAVSYLTFLTILAFFTTTSFAASFDCNKASMPSEKMVCNNPALSKLDDQMFAAYSKAKSESTNPDSLKNEQISWIKEVRACGNDETCISSLYLKRISQLSPTATLNQASIPQQHLQASKSHLLW